MNLPENTDNTDIQPEDNINGLYLGDIGELSLDTRRVLVQLLSGPSIDEHFHSKLWSVLIRDEHIIRKYLAELFLELIIDYDLKISFTRKIDTGEIDTPSLLRRSQLTFIDSVLLLYLRQQLLTQAETHGGRAVVSINDITESLSTYKQSLDTDKHGFNKRIHASIEKFKKYNILQKIRSSDGRYEVSPALKLLFPADKIQELTKIYQSKTLIKTDEDENEEDNG